MSASHAAALSSMMKNRLSTKLDKVDNSMDSITGLSKLIALNYPKAAATVQLWWDKFQKTPSKRLLTYMYVANDVMQNTKKRGPDFVTEFCKVIADALVFTVRRDASFMPKLKRLVDVWQQRNVIPSKYVSEFNDALFGSNAGAHSGTLGRPDAEDYLPVANTTISSPGTPPGSPPEGARLRSKVILQAHRAALSSAPQAADISSGDEEDEEAYAGADADRNSSSSGAGRKNQKSEDDTNAAGGIADALMYHEAVELMIQRLAERFRAIQGDGLFDKSTIPRHLVKGSAEEQRLRDQILANAGVLKQLKHELKQKEERNRSMMTMLALEIEQQSSNANMLERDIESIDDTLALLNKLKKIAANKSKNGKGVPGVLRLKRLKSSLLNISGKRSGSYVNLSNLRDDLKDLDKDDESADANAAALAGKRRQTRYERKPKKKAKKKEVPMVWNRALRAYVPVNIDGSDAAWMSY